MRQIKLANRHFSIVFTSYVFIESYKDWLAVTACVYEKYAQDAVVLRATSHGDIRDEYHVSFHKQYSRYVYLVRRG